MPHHVEKPDLQSLLNLEPRGKNLFRSVSNERNINDRVYGGQLMAQAIVAAAATLPGPRQPTVLQLIFLQGPRAETEIDYAVTELQDGARFSTRHVRASQRGRFVTDAQVSFQTPASGPGHQIDQRTTVPMPEALPLPDQLDRRLGEHLLNGGYAGLELHPFIDYRLIDPERAASSAMSDEPFYLWIRVEKRLPDDPLLHAAALAYLSDWWANYAGLVPHITGRKEDGFYVASLNHSMWFHAPCRADEWLLMVMRSPHAGSHRSLSTADIYTREGLLVASLGQQSLQAPRGPG